VGKFTQWLQLGANVGILAGLILVGTQIIQSNQITGAQLFSANIESVVSGELALVGESPEVAMRRVLFEPEQATRDDYFIADRFYRALLLQLFRAQSFHNVGLYGSQEGLDAKGFARANHRLFACPYGIAYLDQRLNGVARTEYVEAIALMRQLAADSLEVDEMEDRIRRTDAILEQLLKITPVAALAME